MFQNSDFATCTEDALGCSEYDGEFNSAVCVFTENGCLFNLAVDPCEVTDLGDEYPEMRQHFIERLEFHDKHSPDAVLIYRDIVEYSEVEPAVHCDESDFWCPFQEYEDVIFYRAPLFRLIHYHPIPME